MAHSTLLAFFASLVITSLVIHKTMNGNEDNEPFEEIVDTSGLRIYGKSSDNFLANSDEDIDIGGLD